MSKSNVFLNKALIAIFIGTLMLSTACQNIAEEVEEKSEEKAGNEKVQNEELFIATMQKHLDAVSNKDLKALKSTLSPEGEMIWIMPRTEILHTVDSFILAHEEWFQDTTWTFETKIVDTEIGERVGMAVTEIVYSEPERKGKPYFNRMIVSYDLKKVDDKWYIIKDHASSIEKTKMD